jgi:hypothetical protein
MSKKQFFTLIVPALFIGALSVFATDAPEKIGFPMTLVSSLVAFLGSTTYLYYMWFVRGPRLKARKTVSSENAKARR